MRLINLIACEWLSHKTDRGNSLDFSTFFCGVSFVKFSFYESCYHTILLSQIRDR